MTLFCFSFTERQQSNISMQWEDASSTYPQEKAKEFSENICKAKDMNYQKLLTFA